MQLTGNAVELSARERLCGMCVQQVIYCKPNKDVFFILGLGLGLVLLDLVGRGA